MDFRSLKQAFIKALMAVFGNGQSPSLPIAHIDDLFDLDRDIYSEESGRQWVPKKHMGLNADRAQNLGPALVFYTHPDRTVPLPQDRNNPLYKDILQDIDDGAAENGIPGSSAIIVSKEEHSDGGTMTVVIRNEINHASQLYAAMIFGLHGTRQKDGYMKFHKIVMPDVDQQGRVKGMRAVNLYDREDITRALAFAGLCVEQMVHGSPPAIYSNLKRIMKSAIDPSSLPWRKDAAPRPSKPPSGPK